MSRETEDEQRHRANAASDNDARVSCAASRAPEVPPRFLPRLFSLLAMPDADAAERGSAVTAAEAAGETAPRRGRDRRNRPFCSTWTLNAVAAAMHAAWFIVFVLLWALDENEDGSKRDVTFPLFYTSALFGKPPDPPPAGLLVLDALGATDDGSRSLINPYPSCDAPRAARVGTMPVIPAFRDSHLVMSLHWLVASFFALSFLFQAAAAVADAFWFCALLRRAEKKPNDDDVSASLVESSSFEDDDDVAREPTRAAIASWLRFVEYSFSAAVMVVAIALQVGLMDAWQLFALAALTWTTMMLGLVAERVLAVEERVAAVKARTEPSRAGHTIDREDESTSDASNGTGSTAGDDPRRKMRSETAAVASALRVVRWTAHLAGWVSQGVVFVVIIAHFFASQRACEWEASTEKGNRREDNVAPDFVYAIVFAELALFVGFGVTQTAQFARFDRDVYSAGRKCRCQTCRCKSRCKSRRGSKIKEKETTMRETETETETERARCCCGAAAPAPYDRAARSRALARVEAAYIAQSFVSKTLLGWLTYSGNFV